MVRGRAEVPREQERRRARDAPEARGDVREISRNASFALRGADRFLGLLVDQFIACEPQSTLID